MTEQTMLRLAFFLLLLIKSRIVVVTLHLSRLLRLLSFLRLPLRLRLLLLLLRCMTAISLARSFFDRTTEGCCNFSQAFSVGLRLKSTASPWADCVLGVALPLPGWRVKHAPSCSRPLSASFLDLCLQPDVWHTITLLAADDIDNVVHVCLVAGNIPLIPRINVREPALKI